MTWSVQILSILGFKKGAKKLQHNLFSKFCCNLRLEWSFSYLEIFLNSPVLCRAGLTEEYSQSLFSSVSSFPGFVSKLFTNNDRPVFGDGEEIFPFAPVPPVSSLKMKVYKKRRCVLLLAVEGLVLFLIFLLSNPENWASWDVQWASFNMQSCSRWIKHLIGDFHPAVSCSFCELAAIHSSHWLS